MQKFCGECYFIGKGKPDFKSNLTYCGLYLGFTLLYFLDDDLFNPLGYVFGFLFIFSVIKLLSALTNDHSICPLCNHKPLIPLESFKAKSIIETSTINNAELNIQPNKNFSLCTECTNIIENEAIKYRIPFNFKTISSYSGSILLILLALICLPRLDYNSLGITTFIQLAPSIIWLASGIYIIKLSFNKSASCPNCNSNGTMIPINTPRSIERIKENNLTIPTDTQEKTTAPTA